MVIASNARRMLATKLPGWLVAIVDLARPSTRRPWGGAFNGQAARIRMVEEIVRLHGFDAVVETGTYRGTTTDHLMRAVDAPVFTVEASDRYFHYSKWRFAFEQRVRITHGDSRHFLEAFAKRERVIPMRRVFFYLDAHWGSDLPLMSELRTISEAWTESVVLVDDFQVPEDPGYGFDDYGDGKRLSLDCVPEKVLGEFEVFFPAATSADETGARRGCVVLATRDTAATALAAAKTLRRYPK